MDVNFIWVAAYAMFGLGLFLAGFVNLSDAVLAKMSWTQFFVGMLVVVILWPAFLIAELLR